MQAAQKVATHPGLIRHIDESEDSVRMVKAEEVPQRHQFVFLNADGAEVDSIDQAAQIIPIVEVRMIATDGQGKLVAKNRAQLIRIQEYGPAHRLLRSTTMRPNLPPIKPLPQSAP